MSYKLFITGTDTGIGKTYISVGLLKSFAQLGYSAIGVKPIASDSFLEKNILYNQDALDLIQASTIQLDYQMINPFTFKAPISPNIAAKQTGVSLTTADLISKSQPVLNYPADIHIVEGVGGWSVPINETETMADFVSYYGMNIILVVGMRLGCMNHAILTYQAIRQANLPLIGWVANHFEINEMEPTEVIKTLQQWLPIPYLGCVPYQGKPENVLRSISMASCIFTL